MEYGAYWMTVLVVLLLLALFAQRAIEIYTDVRRYVVRWQSEPENTQADPPISPVVETETKAVPAFSNALETPGNSDFRFQSLEAANAYAETLLIDRLAELVLAEKLDKSIAIKVGLRAPTGRAYQAAKERLEATMLKQQYPALTASRTKAAHSH